MKMKSKYFQDRKQEVMEFSTLILMIIGLILIHEADMIRENIRYVFYILGSFMVACSFYAWINRKSFALERKTQ